MFRSVSDSWNRFWWGTGAIPNRINKVEDIYLRFYKGPSTTDFFEFPLSQAKNLFDIKEFNRNNQTVLYIHGYVETAEQESVKVVANAYLEARPDTNFILLDWSNMSHGSYVLNAAGNTKKVGEAAAEQLQKLIEGGLPLKSIHLIGHSLGSQVAGTAARTLKKNDLVLRRITGLDPAFPGFYPDGMMKHICPNDAEFVDIIHTDGGMYGAPSVTGTADFWPNGGTGAQPGCPRFAPIPLSDESLCSHWRSWRYFAESVRNPEAFAASPAESYHKFKHNPTPEVGFVFMGYKCDHKAKGSYYLHTNDAPPFGKGMAGLKKNNHK